jgi:hypothetical protein
LCYDTVLLNKKDILIAFTLLQPNPTVQTVKVTVSDVGSMSNFKYQVTLSDNNLANMADFHIAMTDAGYNPERNKAGNSVSITLSKVGLLSLLVRSILDNYIVEKNATLTSLYFNKYAGKLDLANYEEYVQEQKLCSETVYHIEFSVV